MAETLTNGHAQSYVGTRTIRPDGVDKVTGRARFGADFSLPGQLIGRVLRSPHPHARIISIDTSKAEALPGVKAVITRADFADQPSEFIPAGEMIDHGPFAGRTWLLHTTDAHDLYRKLGFEAPSRKVIERIPPE